MDRDGSGVATVVETFEGKRLNSPNDVDLPLATAGSIFTDPPYGVPSPEAKELPFQGVFRLSADLKRIELLVADDFEKPNGLALSPDERTLYVCDTAQLPRPGLRPRRRRATSTGLRPRVFATMDPGVPGGPDGMKVDRDGRVYVAVALGVLGLRARRVAAGHPGPAQAPVEPRLGGAEADVLAITMIDSVCRVKMGVRGDLPPFA